MSGERLAWMRQAARFGIPLDKYMEQTSSTEFVDWNYFFEEEARQELLTVEKSDHYFALIAYKINQVIEILCDVKAGDRKELKNFILEFQVGDEKPVEKTPKVNPYHIEEMIARGEKVDAIEIGQPLDEKWQKVNDDAFASWAAALAAFGIDIEEASNERDPGSAGT